MNNKIEEKYVNFMVAKLLFDKGFDVITKRAYNSIGIPLDFSTRNSEPPYLSCPTQSVVIDWIEENFKIYVESFIDDDLTFGSCVCKYTDEGRHQYPLLRGYKTRAEAVNEGLLYTLTNVI